jgi:hypothetical protein
MARNDIHQLYETLINTEFALMPRGSHQLQSVYHRVQTQYGHLCDDAYTCDDSCGTAKAEPEWHHAIRRALDVLTTREIRSAVVFHEGHGWWRFEPAPIPNAHH